MSMQQCVSPTEAKRILELMLYALTCSMQGYSDAAEHYSDEAARIVGHIDLSKCVGFPRSEQNTQHDRGHAYEFDNNEHR